MGQSHTEVQVSAFVLQTSDVCVRERNGAANVMPTTKEENNCNAVCVMSVCWQKQFVWRCVLGRSVATENWRPHRDEIPAS